jgi:hypothetical protein
MLMLNSSLKDLVASADAKGNAAASGSSNKFVYWILFGVLAIVVVILARVIGSLKHIVATSEGQTVPHGKTIIQQLTSKGVIGFLIFALVVLGGYTTVNNGIAFGRQQGYQPINPLNSPMKPTPACRGSIAILS